MLRPHQSQGEREFLDVLPELTPAIVAEAAVWVARLHGPDRSSHMERDCLAWQARSAVHRLAFERCTDTWQDMAGITLSSYVTATRAARGRAADCGVWSPRRVRWSLALATVLLAAGGFAMLQPWRDIETYATGVGEQRVVVLQDGTRMSLNTATRVRVELASAQRSVRLEDGEALFEVAKDVHRPFVVRAAGSEVVALGTVFSVRLTPTSARVDDALAVTLIEGRVTVRPVADGGEKSAVPSRSLSLQPGERVSVSEVVDSSGTGVQRVTTQVDRPRIEQVMAWKRNEAVFSDASLADAVAEMNRYSRMTIVLVGAGTMTGRRVSGVFRTRDNAGFARAVAAFRGLVVRELQDRLELAPE